MFPVKLDSAVQDRNEKVFYIVYKDIGNSTTDSFFSHFSDFGQHHDLHVLPHSVTQKKHMMCVFSLLVQLFNNKVRSVFYISTSHSSYCAGRLCSRKPGATKVTQNSILRTMIIIRSCYANTQKKQYILQQF